MLRYFLLFFFAIGLHAADSQFSGTAPERHKDMTHHLTKMPPPETIWTRQYLTGDWNGSRTWMAEQGWTVSSTFISDIQGNPIGGMSQGIAQASSWGADSNFDFGKRTPLKGLTLYTSVVYRFGTNLSETHIGNQFPVAEVFGSETYKLNELYFKQVAFDEKVILKVGRLDTGNDYLQSDLYYNMVSNAFDGNPIAVFLNGFFSAYPNATWGVTLNTRPIPELSAKFGLYNGNSEIFENRFHGANFTFKSIEGAQPISEWGYHTNSRPTDTGLPGNYRIGGFYLTGLKETFLDGVKTGNWTIYFQFDQMVLRHGDNHDGSGLIPFIALLFAPKDRAKFPFFTSGGLIAKGWMPWRHEDSTSLGFAYGRYSSDLRQAQREARDRGVHGKFGCEPQSYELVLELNHWFVINQWFIITPDVQYIINPKGKGTIPDALVIGAQVKIIF